MHTRTLLAAAAAMLAGAAQATTVTQWNFNSAPSDANAGTGSTAAAIGAGTASLVGGTTATFASGDAGTGSSDPATGDDSGWNLTTFAAASSGDKTRGAQFLVSTAGWQGITLSYDLRHSNTASRYEAVQVTVDGGASFTDVATFGADVLNGDTWYLQRSVDLSALAAANDNAQFGFRVVSTFAPGSGSYVASTPGSNYATSGTWRYDMVTVSAVSAVPEPGALALAVAGLGALGVLRRRA